jgi:hypothetical protein
MASTKITELTAANTIAVTDVLPFVSDPSGSPTTKKITANNLANSLFSNVQVSVVPYANVTYNLGSAAKAWNNVYVKALYANGTLGANGTVLASNGTASYWAASTLSVTNSFNPNFSTNTGNVLTGITQTGNYTKIGRLCYFRVYVDYSGVSSYADGSGQYQITLPFPSVATISVRGGTLHNINTASIYHIGGIVDISTNTTTMSLYYSGSTTDLAWKNTTPVSWFTGNVSHFDISGTYETVS